MIPDADAIVAAYAFVARRYRVTVKPDRGPIQDATSEARALTVDVTDEPAALFFALARRPRGLPGLWTSVVTVLVVNHARSLGLALAGDARDLLPLFLPVARGAFAFPELRIWFREHLRPVVAP